MKFIGDHKKEIIAIGAVIGLGLFGWLVYYSLTYRATIFIDFTPSDAKVKLDGKKGSDKNRLKPGEYKIEVSRDGFESHKETIKVNSGEEVTVYAALKPSSQETEGWYGDKASEYQKREKILSDKYDADSEKAMENFKIVKILPFTGPGGGYQIDYGVGSDPNTQAVYISYYTDVGKKLAQDYIKDQGYDLKNYEVKYKKKSFEAPKQTKPIRDH